MHARCPEVQVLRISLPEEDAVDPRGVQIRRESMDREAEQILARASLGEIGLGDILPMIWDRWESITMSGGMSQITQGPSLQQSATA